MGMDYQPVDRQGELIARNHELLEIAAAERARARDVIELAEETLLAVMDCATARRQRSGASLNKTRVEVR